MTKITDYISVAEYQDPGLPEYANNPFISALPLIRNNDVAIKDMEIMPSFDEREIHLPPHIRIHAIQRLINHFFQPMAEHILLEQRFSILIRQSYVGRNPNTSAFRKHLNNGYDRIVNKDINLTVRKDAMSTATGFSIVGPSGCGKTSAVLRCLTDYPRAIFHSDLHVIQIPWLKLECPRNGSLAELCFNFFRAVDNLIGTEYFGRYCKPRVGVDSLIAEMAHIANLHAIGVIIIDEIQHLSRKRSGGDQAMLDFFVTLTNSIGVPVVLVGTPKARSLFATDFKIAKRTTGLGSVNWDRIPSGEKWNRLIKRLWKYQWLTNRGALTQEIIDALHDLSQGVIDVLLKLYVLAQWRAMIVKTESISVGLLKKVYEDELQPVHKMLQALRSGDPEEIAKFGDLTMPDIEIKLLQSFQEQKIFDQSTSEQKEQPLGDKAKIIFNIAQSLGINKDIAIPLIESEVRQNPTMDTMQIVHRLLNVINTPVKPKVKARSKKPNVSEWNQLQCDDIRFMFSERTTGSTYEALKKGGVILSIADCLGAA